MAIEDEATEKWPSGDAIKLALASSAIISFAFLFSDDTEPLWMLVPPVVLVAGLFFGIGLRNLFYIRASTRIVQFLAPAASLILIAYTEFEARSEFASIEIHFQYRVLIYLALLAAVAAGVVLLNVLWLSPLRRNLGRIANFVKNAMVRDPNTIPKIISRESLTSFSNAEELAKWSGLRRDNIISEEEFERIKSRLLNDRP